MKKVRWKFSRTNIFIPSRKIHRISNLKRGFPLEKLFSVLFYPGLSSLPCSFLSKSGTKNDFKRQKTEKPEEGSGWLRFEIPVRAERKKERDRENITASSPSIEEEDNQGWYKILILRGVFPHNSRAAERVTHARRRLYPEGPQRMALG